MALMNVCTRGVKRKAEEGKKEQKVSHRERTAKERLGDKVVSFAHTRRNVSSFSVFSDVKIYPILKLARLIDMAMNFLQMCENKYRNLCSEKTRSFAENFFLYIAWRKLVENSLETFDITERCHVLVILKIDLPHGNDPQFFSASLQRNY